MAGRMLLSIPLKGEGRDKSALTGAAVAQCNLLVVGVESAVLCVS